MTRMYLPIDQWSPRFHSTFFSVTVEAAQKLDTPPPIPGGIGGNTRCPAAYYDVVVYCEHRKAVLLRRYSNFYWLYQQVKDFDPPRVEGDDTVHEPLVMPPGTCFLLQQSADFIKNRRLQLGEFIDELLSRPGFSEHPAVRLFFELDVVPNDES